MTEVCTSWFGGITAHLFLAIDDGSGKIFAAGIHEEETTFNAMKVIKEIIDEHGIPLPFTLIK